MTRDEIMSMEAGPEMDQMVGELIGDEPEITPVASDDGGKTACAMVDRQWGPWRSEHELRLWLEEGQQRGLHLGFKIEACKTWPRYSTSISDAWEVVEKLPIDSQGLLIARCSVANADEYQAAIHVQGEAVWVSGDTAPLAICRAALIATMEGEQ